jgi:hypothetical protein
MKEHSNIQRRVCNIPAKPGHTYCVGHVTIILPTVSSALAGCYADGLSRSLSAGAGRYGYGVQGPTEHNIYRPLGASFSAVQRFRSHTALRSPAVLSCPARAAFLHQKLMMACMQCDMCVVALYDKQRIVLPPRMPCICHLHVLPCFRVYVARHHVPACVEGNCTAAWIALCIHESYIVCRIHDTVWMTVGNNVRPCSCNGACRSIPLSEKSK